MDPIESATRLQAAVNRKSQQIFQKAFESKGGRLLRCSGKGCRRRSLLHPRMRRDGVFLGEEWFCGPDCFRLAVSEALPQPTEEQPVERGAMRLLLPRMPYRLILLKQGLISEADLDRGFLYAAEHGVPLGEALVQMGAITVTDLAAAIASERGYALYSLPLAPVPREMELPLELGEHFHAAAVSVSRDKVMIGFVHRHSRVLLTLAETMFRRRVEGCYIIDEQLEPQRMIQAEQCAEADRNEMARRCRTLPPAAPPRHRQEITDAILAHALGCGADAVQLAHAGDFIWARYTSDGMLCNAVYPALYRYAGADAGILYEKKQRAH